MPRSTIVLIGAERLFTTSIAEALRREHDVHHVEDLERWLTSSHTTADVIVIIAPAVEFGEIRARIRSEWHTGDDPLLLCMDEDDAYCFVSHLYGCHVTRQRLGLADILEVITHQHSGNRRASSTRGDEFGEQGKREQ